MSDSSSIAATLQPPYYAVIFTSIRTDVEEGYGQMAERMVRLASEQPGFLGVESVRENGLGITVSYWATEDALLQWRRNLAHQEAQQQGRDAWYRQYRVRVARVEREYGFDT